MSFEFAVQAYGLRLDQFQRIWMKKINDNFPTDQRVGEGGYKYNVTA